MTGDDYRSTTRLVTKGRTPRRTRYTVNPDSLFRHRGQARLRVGPFLDMLAAVDDNPTPAPEPDDEIQPG
jgi:hypothetical protein